MRGKGREDSIKIFGNILFCLTLSPSISPPSSLLLTFLPLLSSLLFSQLQMITYETLKIFSGLAFIATDPPYSRLGAASLLMKWGLERSRRDEIPAYLESTLEALPFYLKLGFTEAERIRMVLPAGKGGKGGMEGNGEGKEGVREEEDVYEEVCLIFKPDFSSSSAVLSSSLPSSTPLSPSMVNGEISKGLEDRLN